MIRHSKTHSSYIITTIGIDIIFIIWGLAVNCPSLFILLMIVWYNMMAYSYVKIEKRVILFAFGISFFIFLIGREFLEQFCLVKPEYIFKSEINQHLWLSLIIALIGIWGAFMYFNNGSTFINSHARYSLQYKRVRNISRFLFFTVFPFAIIYRLIIAYIVTKSGYSSYYTDISESMDGNIFLSIFNKIDTILSIVFCCYIATLPTKKEFKQILIFYLFYLIISLFGGQRGPFLLGVLLLFIFVVYMQGIFPHEKWFKKKYFNYCLILFPFLASAGSFYNAWRFDKQWESSGIFDGASKFIYEQGVSGYVIKRAYMHEDQIPKDIYFFQFAHSGIIAKILGIPVYNGNTIDHATKGGSFAHALGYVILGNQYLLGRGTGSSYVAELYYDFGYIGIFIGSCLYGFLFSIFFKTKKLFSRITIFVIITQLLWSCRSSYVGFIILLTMPTSIIIGLIIYYYSRKSLHPENRIICP